jgi:hypothetical protein
MTDNGIPIRKETTWRLVNGETKGRVILLLYPDKLAAVSYRDWLTATFAGMAAYGSGTVFPRDSLLQGLTFGIVSIGINLGAQKIAQHLAAAKVAVGSSSVMVIPLDSIIRIETATTKGNQYLRVTTENGTRYGFRVKLDKWSTDLRSALTKRGLRVHVTPGVITVTQAPSAWEQ